MSVADGTAAGVEDGITRAPQRWLLLFALSSGMVAWMVHLVGGSILVPVACEHDLGWTIDALTGVTAVVCVLGVVAGERIRRSGAAGADARSQGYRLLGFVAVTSNIIATALVLAEGAMHIWVSACR